MTEELNQCHKYLSTLRFVLLFSPPRLLLLVEQTQLLPLYTDTAPDNVRVYCWLSGTTKYCDWINYSDVSRKKYRNVPRRKCCFFSPARAFSTLLLHLGDKMSLAPKRLSGNKVDWAREHFFPCLHICGGERNLYLSDLVILTLFCQRPLILSGRMPGS